MKKLFKYLFILIFLFMINIYRVDAQNITIDEVVQKFKENLNELELENLDVQKEDNQIIVKYECTFSTEEDHKDCQTIYNIDNDIISYEFAGNKELENDVYQGFQDTLLSAFLIYSVGELKGYNIEDFQKYDFDDDVEDNFTIEEDGLETKMFTYVFDDEYSHVSGTIHETFKIDINKFDLNNLVSKYGRETLDALINLETTSEGISINIKTSLEDGKVLTIYKSSDNINFEVLDNVTIENNEVSYLDKNVLKETTYYYKVAVENTNVFSEIYEIEIFDDVIGEKEEVVEEITINKLALTKTNEGIVVDIESNLSDGKMVSIYKSTDNEKYDLVAEVSILNQKISYLDELVKEGQTYYYKVVVLDNNNVINKVESIKYNKVDTVVENPQTGIINYLIPTTILLGGSFIGYKKLKRKNVLNKI